MTKIEAGNGLTALSKHSVAVRTTFEGGGAAPRVATHINQGRPVPPAALQMTSPVGVQQRAQVAQVRVGAGSIPLVQRHVGKVELGRGGTLPPVQRHVTRPVFMGNGTLTAVLKHLARQR